MNQKELYQKCFLKIIQNSKEWENFLDFLAFYRGNDLTVLIPSYINTEYYKELKEREQNNKFYKYQDCMQMDNMIYTMEEIVQKILPKEQMTNYEFEIVFQSVLYLLKKYEGEEIDKRNCFGNVIYLNTESTLKVLAFIQNTLNKIIIWKDWEEMIWGMGGEKVGIYGKMGMAWLKEKNYYRYLKLIMEDRLLNIYQEVDHLANKELDYQIKKQLGRIHKYGDSENNKAYQQLEFQVIKWKAEQVVLKKIVFVDR